MGIKIGWGIRTFSADVPCNISGQMNMRRSKGVLDPLRVTALCLEGGNGGIVVFVSCDIAALGGPIMEDVAKAVHEKFPFIPEDAVIMNATHTHTSYDIWTEGDTFPDGSYRYNGPKCRELLYHAAVAAVTEAVEGRKEGGMAYGYGYAVVGHSRRSIYSEDMSKVLKNRTAPNGHAIMYGKTNRPQFWGYEAGADHFLNAMFTFDAEDKLTGIIVNVPCPSQTSESLHYLSADYWNEVREFVKKTFGENVYVLPQCAAAGDTAPRILHYYEAQARRITLKYDLPYVSGQCPPGSEGYLHKVMGERYDIADRIVTGLKDIYGWAKNDIQKDVPVRHICRIANVRKRLITAEEKAWCENELKEMELERPDPNLLSGEEYSIKKSEFDSIWRRNERTIERYLEEQAHPEDTTIETTIHTVQVGDIAFATTMHEIYQDFMHRLQARSPFIQTFYIELCGFGSYIATTRGRNNKGYSASMYCNRISDEGGQDIVENSLEMFDEMLRESEK